MATQETTFGVFMGVTDQTIDVRDLARAVEERRFESLFVPEHTHIPTSRETPWGGGRELPMGHKRGLDPFLAVAAAASVTSTLLLGTGVCLVPARDPILFAKEVATADLLSAGRLLLGVGAGWNREEIADHGVEPAKRFDVMADRIAAAKALWASEVAEYHGTHVDFEPTWQWPKPVQQPHPPILVGGQTSAALDRVVAYGDGWMPFVGHSDEGLAESIEALRRKLDRAGRPMVPVSVFGLPADVSDISGYLLPGVDRLIFRLPPSAHEDAILQLERLASTLGQREG